MSAITIQKYEYIDSLRWIAIIWVILWHLHLIWITTPKIFNVWMMGVPLFFIISAFTLCLTYHKRKDLEQKPNLKFYIRRLFRIVPVFVILTTLVFFIMKHIDIGIAFDGSLINRLTHISFTYWFSQQYMGSMMMGERSLFNEVVFYICFPAIFLYITKDHKKTLLFAAMTFVICYLYNIFWNSVFGLDKSYVYTTPLTHFFSFSLWFVLFAFRDYTLPKVYMHILYAANIIGFIILGYIHIFYGMHLFPFFIINLALLVFLCARGGLYTLITNQVYSYIGKISYSMYLINIPLLTTIGYLAHTYTGVDNTLLQNTLLVISSLSLLIALSSLSYYTLEMSSISLGKKYLQKYDLTSL